MEEATLIQPRAELKSKNAIAQAHLRQVYSEALVALRDRLAKQGTGMVFAVYPSHQSVRRKELSGDERWALQMARSADITTADLLSPLWESELPIEVLYLLPHDGHPSAHGYRVTARFMAEAIHGSDPLATACK